MENTSRLDALPMSLPASPDLDHLKKQAKHLLRDALGGDAVALERFVDTLPAAQAVGLAALAAHRLVLADAQSVVAREYGFRSWIELKRYVEWQHSDQAERLKSWAKWAYEGNGRERRLALRMLREEFGLFQGDAWLACAVGDLAGVEAAIAADAGFVNRAGGLRGMAPLVAVTHSKLILEEGFEAGLLACAALLLERGADPDVTWTNPEYPDWPLPALYGAAGYTHNVAMTRLLLGAGANPTDNESLYHSVEGHDPDCTYLLLEAGARVAGANSVAHVLDYDKLDELKALLRYGRSQNGDENGWLDGAVHHAVLRGRSLEHVRAVVEAGADLRFVDKAGISVYCWTQMHGRADVVALLRKFGVEEPLTLEEEFVAAATRGDEKAARAILERVPGIFSQLRHAQLAALPDLASTGGYVGVRTMLALGWPREVKTGWGATALNWSVFAGDAAMAGLLLEYGADWQTVHGFNDNVVGTLSWASLADDPGGPVDPDYLGCARVLVNGGVPLTEFDRGVFSPEVADFLASCRLSAS